ncbi:MAG: NUDIX hydrolase [Anaerolineales bacterium]|nr:NUDIX hydrolase [Anaerolineales bacterium]
MSTNYDPQWLQWAKQLQAIAQIGLTYAQNPYDVERYEAIRQVAAEMMATASATALSRVLDLFAGEVGYATPKIDTRGVVFRDEALLLVKEISDGGWTLPGGWADVNDSPSEAVVREIFEESGFQTWAVKLLAVYDRSKHPHTPPFPYHIYKLFFRCEITGGMATRSMETADIGFFREHEIPELSISRVTPGQITRLFEHYRHPDWPTDFD